LVVNLLKADSLLNIFFGSQKYPAQYFNQEFYKLTAETIILFTPILPHFSSELWARLRKSLKIDAFDLVFLGFFAGFFFFQDFFCKSNITIKNKMVTEQKWPEIDDKWQIELNFNV
jgi:hypothetical protein